MVRVGSISLVLLYMVSSTFGLYRYSSRSSYGTSYNPASTYRSPYGSTYGSTYGAGYGAGYGAAAYKTSISAVSVAPLCKSDGRMMLRVYVEEDHGTPVSNAKVSYVDGKIFDTVSTDLYGYIAIPVYGCTVALIVYHKDGNPIYKTVDLLSSRTREEKVVIKVDDKCNFKLYFAHEGHGPGNDDGTVEKTVCASCGDEHQIVSVLIASKDHTGYANYVAKTACITAGENGDRLLVRLQSQYGNIFNVLNITITNSRFAVISLPPQLVDDEKKFKIVLESNTYEKVVDPADPEIVNKIASWSLFPNTVNDAEIDEGDTSETFTDVSSFVVKAGELAGNEWLLAVQFETSADDDSTVVDLEGNVVVIDCNGDYQSVEHPDSMGADYKETDWFLVGCFCNNVPSMKAGDFIAIGEYVTDTGSGPTALTATPYATHCNQICVDNNTD